MQRRDHQKTLSALEGRSPCDVVGDCTMEAAQAAPVLSTPDAHFLEQGVPDAATSDRPQQSEEQLNITYEIQRTVAEIRAGRWRRIALQFPDQMLPDAPWVSKALSRGLQVANGQAERKSSTTGTDAPPTPGLQKLQLQPSDPTASRQTPHEKIFILADTSYGSCCVDEVAAEHADADVIVHYGRSCLSPTARLPVLYVFTTPPLDLDGVCSRFAEVYPDKKARVMLTADIPYVSRLSAVSTRLRGKGYAQVFTAELKHDISSPLPNRTVPEDVALDSNALSKWQLFHVSDPPEALLLSLSSKIQSLHICPATSDHGRPEAKEASSAKALRRRYATTVKLATVPIFGILVNTLSVKDYMGILGHVKKRIAEAGKKSYTFVVGKVNAAKIANFSEVGGWVVIGCWESSLLESKDFWKPVITPFELELALASDTDRVWSGQWSSDFQAVLHGSKEDASDSASLKSGGGGTADSGTDSEEESAPPEFDLRTGRYVSHSQPVGGRRRHHPKMKQHPGVVSSQSLTKKANGDVASIGGVVSPAAEFFRNKRTWQGLGSDFEVQYDEGGAVRPGEGAQVEPGRKGIAKGYSVSSAGEGTA